jgi:hypothetical protein
MTPDQFIARLIALVPPPAFHVIRYSGLFANGVDGILIMQRV